MSDATGFKERLSLNGWGPLIARCILGGMFVWLGTAKLGDPVQFLKTLREYGMFPSSMPFLMNSTAAWLPWIEIFAGTLLIAGVAVRGIALMFLTMLIVFSSAIFLRASGVASADDISFCAVAFDCGCGTGEQNVCAKLGENVLLILLGAIVLLSRSRKLCLRGDLIRKPA
ncbi:MAG: DoxX family membrane protein [Planctomycetota bacterium]